jgi:hypothetical protein
MENIIAGKNAAIVKYTEKLGNHTVNKVKGKI